MSTKIDNEVITMHIETINSLLKNQKYNLMATLLTTSERKKLYDFFFTYKKFGGEMSNFGDWYELGKQKDVDRYNEKVYKNSSDEIRAIILKCGVAPQKVYLLKDGSCQMDSALENSMKAYSTTKVGAYTIELTRNHPIDWDSVELEAFRKEIQPVKFNQYKDGAATIRVSCNIDGQSRCVYDVFESMHQQEPTVFFNGVQISGDFGLSWRYCVRAAGRMNQEKRIDFTPFILFAESFEKLLTDNISLKNENEVNGHSKKIVKG